MPDAIALPPAWLPVAIAIAGALTALAILVAAVVLRLLDRRVPDWAVPAAAFAFGLATSILVVDWPTDSPDSLFLLVPVVVAPAAMMAFARRFDLAGWYLVGAGGPGAAWWAFFAGQELTDAVSLIAWLGGGLAILLVGLAGIAFGNRERRPPPLPPPTDPDPSRAIAIFTAVQRELRFGPIDLPNLIAIVLGVLAGTTIGLVLAGTGLDGWVVATLAVFATALLATEVFYHAWPRRLSRAMAAHAFVGSWEMKRFIATTGTKPPTSLAAARRWLESNPETDANRWVRPELLAWAGRIEEAYDVVRRMPDTTEAERFERRALETFLDIVAGRPADIDGLATAAERVGTPGSDEQLRAVAVAALAESRRRLAVGEVDWMEPLVGAQERIGPRALGIQRADTWLLRFRVLALASGAFVAIGSLLSLISF